LTQAISFCCFYQLCTQFELWHLLLVGVLLGCGVFSLKILQTTLGEENHGAAEDDVKNSISSLRLAKKVTEQMPLTVPPK
jgi:hypothetical protein